MRILVIADHIPYPPSSGTSIRNYNLLKRLARAHEVWLVCFAREEDGPAIEHLRSFCQGVETVAVKLSHALERPGQALEYILHRYPIELRHYHSPLMAKKIQQLCGMVAFDVVDIIDSYMGLYLESLPETLHHKTVLTFIDIVFNKYERIWRLEPTTARKFRMWLYACGMRDWEPCYAMRFARRIMVSDADGRLLRSRNSLLDYDVVPNGIDTTLFQPLPLPSGPPALLFVGNMNYRPNIDAVQYFCAEIFPAVRAAVPGVQFHITGINPSAEVLALQSADIHVTGAVDDVRPWYGLSTICVVPLRAGGGTRLKILESMALGRPVVSTSIGCEGIAVEDGRHLLVADDPASFSAKILHLFGDASARERIIARARELAVRQYDWDVITERLLQIYAEVAL